MFSRYVAHVFSEWLWNSHSRPIITGITFVFTFRVRCISIVSSLYFRIFSASFLITFLSPEITTSINTHVPFSLSRIIMSGLLLGIVLSVCTCWLHNMATLPPWFIIIIIIFVLTFMQGIYNNVPEINHISTVFNVAAVLYLQSVLHEILFHKRNIFCTLHQHFPQFVCSAQYGWFL